MGWAPGMGSERILFASSVKRSMTLSRMKAKPKTILTPEAITRLREIIQAHGGREILFNGYIDRGRIARVEVAAFGSRNALPLIFRSATIQAHIHNHPSGHMVPSLADIELAAVYQIPAFIVNNSVTKINVLVPMENGGTEPDYFWENYT